MTPLVARDRRGGHGAHVRRRLGMPSRGLDVRPATGLTSRDAHVRRRIGMPSRGLDVWPAAGLTSRDAHVRRRLGMPSRGLDVRPPPSLHLKPRTSSEQRTQTLSTMTTRCKSWSAIGCRARGEAAPRLLNSWPACRHVRHSPTRPREILRPNQKRRHLSKNNTVCYFVSFGPGRRSGDTARAGDDLDTTAGKRANPMLRRCSRPLARRR